MLLGGKYLRKLGYIVERSKWYDIRIRQDWNSTNKGLQ